MSGPDTLVSLSPEDEVESTTGSPPLPPECCLHYSAATGWEVPFFASVSRENSRSDPAQTPLTGHRCIHTNDAYYGRDTDDNAFRIIQLGEHDTFIQFDSGYGGDIPTHVLKDSLTGPPTTRTRQDSHTLGMRRQSSQPIPALHRFSLCRGFGGTANLTLSTQRCGVVGLISFYACGGNQSEGVADRGQKTGEAVPNV